MPIAARLSAPAPVAITSGTAPNTIDMVVISTGRHTFERIVSSARFCQPGQVIENYWVPTRDRSSCLAGYICKEYEPRFRLDD